VFRSSLSVVFVWMPSGISFTWAVLCGLGILLPAHQGYSQVPAVNSLSSGLSDVVNRSGRKTVAVVDFTDLQGCVTELGRYMAEDVSVALVNNAKGFDVIDRTNLRVIMQEHKLASSGIIDPATARRLGQVAGVDALVTGTIAPVGDSVHVSVKVLDTESARMFGGVTADIPRTKTVEDLLAKGVSNCRPTQSERQIIASVPGQGSEVSPIRLPVGSGHIGDFIISLESCDRAGEVIRCSGTVMNAGKERQRFLIDNGGSYMLDNLANQSKGSSGFGGFGFGGRGWESSVGSGTNVNIEPNLPLKLSVSGHGLSEQASSVSIVFRISIPGGTITLRNIPIRDR
jgi:TolB-like protein